MELVTAAELAEELEVSPRTIYRDVRDLIASGVPIEGELKELLRNEYELVRLTRKVQPDP